MVWKAAYYIIKKDNYLKASTLLLCICSISAVALNIEGSNCIRQVNSLVLSENSIDGEAQVNQRNDTGFSNEFQQQVEERRQQQQQQQLEQENSQSQDAKLQQSYELRKYCFLVTNMYVYSLFGVIIGFILLVIWYIRYKQIWAWKKNKDNSL
ncbi:MAG TPA: hypothetical protein VFY50_00855 [Candidatus Nitrosocosmicus sp.]|nr:hypothetical protein [Candidatus Nitrosocosmicus sp.]